MRQVRQKIKHILKILLERNMLIFCSSILLFYILFCTPQGIIKSYYDFHIKRNSLQAEIEKYEKNLKLLNKKRQNLKLGNKDLLEELEYFYFNRDPYGKRVKKIINI